MKRENLIPIVFLITFGLILIVPFIPINYNKSLVIIITTIAILGILSILKLRDENSISYFKIRPITFFLIGYFIVYFQLYIDLLFGNVSQYDIRFASPDLINISVIFATIGLYTFILGYLFFRINRHPIINKCEEIKKINPTPFKIVFIIASLLKIKYMLDNLFSGVIYTQEMLENSSGGIQNYSSILFMTTFYAFLSIHTYNLIGANGISIKKYTKEFGIFPFICLFVTVVTMLVCGSRSPVIIILSSIAFSYIFVSQKKVSWIKIVFSLVAFSLVMMFVAVSRVTIGNTSTADIIKIIETNSSNKNSIFLPTLEYAGSLKTLNYSLQYVPEKHDYLYGNFQGRAVLAAIPFSARITSQFLNPDRQYISSAFFVTHIIQGDNYLWGEGTSILADLYLDFGLIGIIIGMFLLGLFFRLIEYKIFIKSPNKNTIFYICMGIVLMGNAFAYSRYAYLDFFNYMVFAIILIVIFTQRRHFSNT